MQYREALFEDKQRVWEGTREGSAPDQHLERASHGDNVETVGRGELFRSCLSSKRPRQQNRWQPK